MILGNRASFHHRNRAAAPRPLACVADFKFKEVPVCIDDNSASHFNPVLESFRIYFVLLRYALSSIATALTDFLVFYMLTAEGIWVLSANMSARAFALWIQFMLLKQYVFNSKAGLSTFTPMLLTCFSLATRLL